MKSSCVIWLPVLLALLSCRSPQQVVRDIPPIPDAKYQWKPGDLLKREDLLHRGEQLDPDILPDEPVIPESGETAATRRSKVRFSGDEFSREVRKHGGKSVPVITVTGNARVSSDDLDFRASRVEILGDQGDVITISGKLRAQSTARNIRFEGEKAVYTRHNEVLVIESPGDRDAVFYHTDKSGELHSATARRIIWNRKASIIKAQRSVRFNGPAFLGVADEADYQPGIVTATLSGDARIFYRDTILLSESLFYDKKAGSVKSISALKIIFAVRSESGSDTAVVDAVLSGDTGIYLMARDPARDIARLVAVKQPVRFERSRDVVECDFSETFGQKAEKARFRSQVYGRFPDRGVYIFSESVEVNEDAGLYRLSRVESSESLPTIFIEEADEIQVRVTGHFLEYYMKSKSLTGRGAVQVAFFAAGQKRSGREVLLTAFSENARLSGELAETIPETNWIQMSGDASVRQNDSVIYSQQILVNLEERRFEMLGSLRGVLR